MALKAKDPPPGTLNLIKDGLARLQKSAERAIGGATPFIGPAALFSTNRASMAASAPHPVYDLGLDAIVAGKGLDAAVLTTWRYVIEGPVAKAVAVADVAVGGASPPAFAGVTSGPQIEGLRSAVEFAEGLDSTRTVDYELRLLRVPALSVAAVWLFSQSAENLLIPIRPCPPEVTAGRPYASDTFLAALKQPAAQRLAFHD